MKPENKGKSVLLEDGKIMKCPNFVQNGNCDGRSQIGVKKLLVE